jgi:hypothetical protein
MLTSTKYFSSQNAPKMITKENKVKLSPMFLGLFGSEEGQKLHYLYEKFQ